MKFYKQKVAIEPKKITMWPIDFCIGAIKDLPTANPFIVVVLSEVVSSFV